MTGITLSTLFCCGETFRFSFSTCTDIRCLFALAPRTLNLISKSDDPRNTFPPQIAQSEGAPSMYSVTVVILVDSAQVVSRHVISLRPVASVRILTNQMSIAHHVVF